MAPTGPGRTRVGRVTGTWPTGPVRSSGKRHLADCLCRTCSPETHQHGPSCACDDCYGTSTADAYRPAGGPDHRLSITADTLRDDWTTDDRGADWRDTLTAAQSREGERSALVTWVPQGHGPQGDAQGQRGDAPTGKRCRCQLCAPKARGRARVRANGGHRDQYNASRLPTPDRGVIRRWTVDTAELARYVDRDRATPGASTLDSVTGTAVYRPQSIGGPLHVQASAVCEAERLVATWGVDRVRTLSGQVTWGPRDVGPVDAPADSGPTGRTLHTLALGPVDLLARSGKRPARGPGRTSKRADAAVRVALTLGATVDDWTTSTDDAAALLAMVGVTR